MMQQRALLSILMLKNNGHMFDMAAGCIVTIYGSRCTTSTRWLCDLSSAGKFGQGETEAKLSQGG